MKSKYKLFYYLLLFDIILILGSEQVLSQNKAAISFGFGFPELLNVGISTQYEQIQFGIKVGFFPAGEGIISISGDIYYHFAGVSTLSTRRLWYVKSGLNYLRDETEYFIDEYYHFNLRIGRDFYGSKRIGFRLDVGLFFLLLHEKSIKKPGGWDFDIEFPVLPSFGMAFFYET